MGRIISIPITATAATVAVDFCEILAASGKPYSLHEVVIGQTSDYGDAQAEGLLATFKRATGSFTSGSGGSSVTTFGKANTSDTAGGMTAEIFNTTQASAGSGALTTFRIEPFNIQSGLQYLPIPEDRYEFMPGEALVISLPAPADSLTWAGTVVIEELG